MTYHQELQHRLFQQQEEQVHHMEYQQEFQYYEDVANGRLGRIHLQLLQPKDITAYNAGEYGMPSKNPLRNLRYHFVVSVAMITRLCVEHGLEQELAYTMSDLYINKMDELQQAEAIISLQNDMLLDFTQKMADLPKRHGYSIHVIKGMEYICRHLHQRLTVTEVAAALSVNRSYFSTLFAKETGCQSVHPTGKITGSCEYASFFRLFLCRYCRIFWLFFSKPFYSMLSKMLCLHTSSVPKTIFPENIYRSPNPRTARKIGKKIS